MRVEPPTSLVTPHGAAPADTRAAVPPEEAAEVEPDYAKATVEEKKRMVWDVRKFLEENDGEDDEGGDDGAGPKHVTLAPTPAEAVRKYRSDPERALYLLCQHKDLTFAFFRERRSFARRVVKPSHSLPLVRLMVYGWQPTVSHTDFAGILNANALYSFTIGFPQLGCSIAYIIKK